MGQLWRSFQEGGWAMWGVFAFGLTAVGTAGRFAWRGEHQLLAFVRWLTLTLLAAGGFGFVVGMQRALMFVSERLPRAELSEVEYAERRSALLLVALQEASNNVSGALMFAVLVCLLVAVGHRRYPLPNPSAVPR